RGALADAGLARRAGAERGDVGSGGGRERFSHERRGPPRDDRPLGEGPRRRLRLRPYLPLGPDRLRPSRRRALERLSLLAPSLRELRGGGQRPRGDRLPRRRGPRLPLRLGDDGALPVEVRRIVVSPDQAIAPLAESLETEVEALRD